MKCYLLDALPLLPIILLMHKEICRTYNWSFANIAIKVNCLFCSEGQSLGDNRRCFNRNRHVGRPKRHLGVGDVNKIDDVIIQKDDMVLLFSSVRTVYDIWNCFIITCLPPLV